MVVRVGDRRWRRLVSHLRSARGEKKQAIVCLCFYFLFIVLEFVFVLRLPRRMQPARSK